MKSDGEPDSDGAHRRRLFGQFGVILVLMKFDGLECLDNVMDDAFMAQKGIESKK